MPEKKSPLFAQQLLIKIAETASKFGVLVKYSKIYIKGDRTKYKVTNIEYDEVENEFLLEVEEDG